MDKQEILKISKLGKVVFFLPKLKKLFVKDSTLYKKKVQPLPLCPPRTRKKEDTCNFLKRENHSAYLIEQTNKSHPRKTSFLTKTIVIHELSSNKRCLFHVENFFSFLNLKKIITTELCKLTGKSTQDLYSFQKSLHLYIYFTSLRFFQCF